MVSAFLLHFTNIFLELMRSFHPNSPYGQGTFRREASPQLVRVPLKVYWFENCLGAFHLSEVVNLPWVPEVFSCGGNTFSAQRPNSREAKLFARVMITTEIKPWPKPETAHEKSLAPRAWPTRLFSSGKKYIMRGLKTKTKTGYKPVI